MRAIGAAELLDLWERGISLALPRLALALLGAACPELDDAALAALPLGRRDALLMELREHLFGSELTLASRCPSCAEALESTIALPALRQTLHAPRAAGSIERRGITFRVPTAGDVVDLPDDAEAACRELLARCADASGATSSRISRWSDREREAVADAIAAAAPDACTTIGMTCPACAQRWDVAFDIVAFLWREVDAWAKRMLRDVHALARAYAWREADILALGPTRRQLYLELSQA